MKRIITERARMQKLAGIMSEAKNDESTSEMLNEDFLELKSIAKQLFSLIKAKGYDAAIVENSSKSKYGQHTLVGQKYLNQKGGTVEIHQFTDVEQIGVFVPAYAVIYQLIIDPANAKYVESVVARNRPDLAGKNIGLHGHAKEYWTHIKNYMVADSGKLASAREVMQDEGVKQKINQLGKDLQNAIKSKYPNMKFAFDDGPLGYGMFFAEPRTAKGAVQNPNQRPNQPKPQQKPTEPKMAAEGKIITKSKLREMVESVLFENDYGKLDWVEELDIDEEGRSGVYDVFYNIKYGDIEIDGKQLSEQDAKAWVLRNLKKIVKLSKADYNPYDTVDMIEKYNLEKKPNKKTP